jgi:hypothetical protein
MARREGGRIQLFTRNGHDWRQRYPLIAAALAVLPMRYAAAKSRHPVK